MKNLQYINDNTGKPIYVIIPFEDFQKLDLESRLGLEVENPDDWQDVEFEQGENDNTPLIPNEIVNIMIDKDVSLLTAWRLFRNLSQYDVAEQTGLTQSAISQAERKDSKPQRKTLERLAKVYNCKPEQMAL